MLSGSHKFRGISYKVAMGYMADQKYDRAIREFATLPNYENDAQICELMARCYKKMDRMVDFEKYIDIAISQYAKEENEEKAKKLKEEFKR
jgi:hypothetical protein